MANPAETGKIDSTQRVGGVKSEFGLKDNFSQ
jgi:hypothetical protein